MKIHEYQAKELLAAAGAAVPRGIVVSTPAEAVAAFESMGGKPVVLKAQVHAGGRGKGRFKDSGTDFGGVKYLTKRDDVARVAEVMFKYPLVTKQTGEQGQKVSKALVQEAADIAREIYVGMVLDRALGLPVLMASKEGGVEIEEVAARDPDAILKLPVDPRTGLEPFQARRLAYALDFDAGQAPKAEAIMTALCRVFLDKDCSLAEINPLVVTPSGDVIVLDAKMSFDDNGLFRHPEIAALRDETEETAAELRAQKANLSFIKASMRAPLLSRGREFALARRWRQGGDTAALHELVRAYTRLVIATAGRFRSYGLPLGDLVQEGNVGLMQAAARFEPERDVRFSTYAAWWIRSAMQD